VRATTASAFTALVNGFFISFTALLPINIGVATLAMGAHGALNALSLGLQLARHLPRYRALRQGGWLLLARGLLLVTISLFIYGYELYYAVQAVRSPSDVGPVYVIGILVVCVFGLGLLRAWELLGERRAGPLGWLSPLSGQEDLEEVGVTDAPGIPARPDDHDDEGSSHRAPPTR
jgi:hypothetical protein